MLALSPPTVRPFTFQGHNIRTLQHDGEPWFVLSDVCAVLDIANSRDAASRLDDDEKGVAIADTLGGRQQVATVNESGIYSLIFTSRKPEAKAFKRWVTSIVLPMIREQGSYQPAGFVLPQSLPEALRLAADQAERAEAIREELEQAAPKAAALDRLEAAGGSFCVTDAAKVLKVKRPALVEQMIARGLLYRRAGGGLVGSSSAMGSGLIEHREGTYGGSIRCQPLVTAKGMARLARIFTGIETVGRISSRSAGASDASACD